MDNSKIYAVSTAVLFLISISLGAYGFDQHSKLQDKRTSLAKQEIKHKEKVSNLNSNISRLEQRLSDLESDKSRLQNQVQSLEEDSRRPMIMVYDASYRYTNSNEMTVSISVYNFGETQADELTVVTQFQDSDTNEVVQEELLDMGSLAGGESSTKSFEITANEGVRFDESIYGASKVVDCRDCVILMDRMNSDVLFEPFSMASEDSNA